MLMLEVKAQIGGFFALKKVIFKMNWYPSASVIRQVSIMMVRLHLFSM